jgi:hypothetical protein
LCQEITVDQILDFEVLRKGEVVARSSIDNPADPRTALAENTAKRFDAKAHYKDVLDARGNELMSVNERSGPASKAYMALTTKLEQDQQQLQRIKTAVRRPISRWNVATRVLVMIGAILALLEAFANKFLFDVALQSVGFVSYAVSVAITAFLLIMAHIAGSSIRQIWSDYRHKIIWSAPIIFVVALGLALTIVAILTVARAAFATEAGTIGELLTNVSGTVQSNGVVGALISALADTSALVLATINLGGIGATFLLAFFSHDSDRDFDKAQDAVDRHEKAMEKVHGTYLDERAKIIKRHAPDLVGYAANYNSANSQVIAQKTKLDIPLDDDDRLVVTDLDQLSEDQEKADQEATGRSTVRIEPSVTSMSDYRRQTGTEGT